MTPSKPFTHTAWMFKTETIRRGRRVGRWINEGDARIEANGDVNVFVHSTPVGGFFGHIYLARLGNPTPDAPPPAQRQDNEPEDSEDSEI